MSYDKKHKSSECDKCLKKVGKKNLIKLPFIYLDKNDDSHEDKSITIREDYKTRLINRGMEETIATRLAEEKCDTGYRQYWVCKNCKLSDERIQEARRR